MVWQKKARCGDMEQTWRAAGLDVCFQGLCCQHRPDPQETGHLLSFLPCSSQAFEGTCLPVSLLLLAASSAWGAHINVGVGNDQRSTGLRGRSSGDAQQVTSACQGHDLVPGKQMVTLVHGENLEAQSRQIAIWGRKQPPAVSYGLFHGIKEQTAQIFSAG